MAEHKIKFGTLHPDGTVTDEREITKEDVRRCPFFILVPEHYREDGTCRCDDPTHVEMRDWEYVWSEERQRWEG